jgi:pimeloyl-ACP methyl ester carboxylesterase
LLKSIAVVTAVLALSGSTGALAQIQAAPTPAAIAPSPIPWLTVEDLRQKYGLPGAHITKIGGVDVYYMDEGQGPAILMIHGSSSSLRTWDGVVARLKGRYRTIRYDIPPMGLSGPVSDEAAAKLKPTDIPIALLEHLGVKTVTVFGVSSGGTMGVQLAAARPDLVERLILSNTPADPVTTGHLRESPAFKAEEAQMAKTGFSSRRFWTLFFDFFAGDPRRYSPAMQTQFYDINRKTPEKNRISLTAVVADHAKAVAAMNAVKAPTLLIWGGADPLLVPKSADALESYLTSTRVSKIFLNDVGHYPPIEVPGRWTDIAVAYMESDKPPASGAH